MTNFDSDLHEDLFALFILYSNYLFMNDGKFKNSTQLVTAASINYGTIWDDRAICDEEFEGKVVFRDYSDSHGEYRTTLIVKHKTKLGPLVYSGEKILIKRDL